MRQKEMLIGSLNLSYRESGGTDTPVMLIHGNSSSGHVFQNQLTGWFGEKYRVVAIDLPGHGSSDSAADATAYSLPMYADVVVRAAAHLGMDDAVFVGWSLGGHIVLEAHHLLPNARGFAIFGTPPLAFPPAMEAAFLPSASTGFGFQQKLSPEQAKAFAMDFFAPDSTVDIAPFVSTILATDGNARAGLAASIAPDGFQDEVEVVANMEKPIAVFHGKSEQLVSLDYIKAQTMPTLWRQEVQVIDSAGHAPHWEQPQAFNMLLDHFIEEAME